MCVVYLIMCVCKAHLFDFLLQSSRLPSGLRSKMRLYLSTLHTEAVPDQENKSPRDTSEPWTRIKRKMKNWLTDKAKEEELFEA